MKTIVVSLSGEEMHIDRTIFTLLFNNSVAHRSSRYEKTLKSGKIGFTDFVDLSRKAEIPYSLFFAPKELVKISIRRKNQIILSGVSKGMFSLNSRGNVEVKDVELIIKDILRKQGLIRQYIDFPDNMLVGFLKNSELSISEQADELKRILNLDISEFHKMTKTKTLEYLVSKIEENNVFVSQSSRLFMPQLIHKDVMFSGMCIKDKKCPFIFINGKDELLNFEPEGRKIFTLVLLTVCISKSIFSPISFKQQAKGLIKDETYLLTEEILMPEKQIRSLAVNSIEELKQEAEKFSVTPSALLMRLIRLNEVADEDAINYRIVLKDEFNKRLKPNLRNPRPVNGFKKYNGVGFSKIVFELIDSGKVTSGEAIKVLTQNKQRPPFLFEFRASI